MTWGRESWAKGQMMFCNRTGSWLGFWGFLRADLHFLGYGEAWPLGHLRDKHHHLSSRCVLPESLGRHLESGGGAAQTVRGCGPSSTVSLSSEAPNSKSQAERGQRGWPFTPYPFLLISYLQAGSRPERGAAGTHTCSTYIRAHVRRSCEQWLGAPSCLDAYWPIRRGHVAVPSHQDSQMHGDPSAAQLRCRLPRPQPGPGRL